MNQAHSNRNHLNRFFKTLFFALFVRPLVQIVIGLNIRHAEHLPKKGPAILIANHNSHLDTLVLMSLFPLRLLPRLRPAAAADYFLSNKMMSWFSTCVLGIIPVTRVRPTERKDAEHPLDGVLAALGQGDIVIFFPEGTRGMPEKLVQFKSGIAHLSEQHPKVPIIPFFMHGLGKALPRGEAIFVPFFCDIFVGEPITWQGDKTSFVKTLQARIEGLSREANRQEWT
jgi:1-acyl-sn-glycerol-3-phosphate acyltransferase